MDILARRIANVQPSYHSGYDPCCPHCVSESEDALEYAMSRAEIEAINAENDLAADVEWAERMAAEAQLQADEEDREEFLSGLNAWLDAIEAGREVDELSTWHESEIRAAGWDPSRIEGAA